MSNQGFITLEFLYLVHIACVVVSVWITLADSDLFSVNLAEVQVFFNRDLVTLALKYKENQRRIFKNFLRFNHVEQRYLSTWWQKEFVFYEKKDN